MMQTVKIKCLLAGLTVLVSAPGAYAQLRDTVAGIPVNYDESKAGTCVLPDPLRLNNGKKVTDKQIFINRRRPEILEDFREDQFGRVPANKSSCTFDVFDHGTPAFNKKAIRKQVRIFFSEDTTGPKADVLIYLPSGKEKPVPLMLMINFTANSSMVDDPGVRRGEVWNREHQKVPAPERSVFGTFDVRPFLDHGIGVAMVYYGDIEPDFAGGIKNGVCGMFLHPGEENPRPDEWGAIAAWAWGLSRVMDYLETESAVDNKRIGLFGISRLGKTVLWAAASDSRFALVIASCSGEGGAALSRRNFGETIAHLTAPSRFPYQFCVSYQKFADDPGKLPMDAHMLLALIAPRPVLLQTGSKDLWSDPKGEFLAAVAAGPVYELFGKKGLETDHMPPAGDPILNPIGYYMHEGGHGILPSDIPVFIEFLQKNLLNNFNSD